MKKIMIILRVWLTNWGNYLGLSLLIYLFIYVLILFEMIDKELNNTLEAINNASLEDILVGFLFPLLVHIPFTFGYLFFQFLIDSLLLFVFKFSIKKTIRIENYIFILTLLVAIFFTILIQYSESKIDSYEVIKFSLIGGLILILCSSAFIYTQKRRIKKLEKILGTKASCQQSV